MNSWKRYHAYCDEVNSILSSNNIISHLRRFSTEQCKMYLQKLSVNMSHIELPGLLRDFNSCSLAAWSAYKGRENYRNKYYSKNTDDGHEYQITQYRELYRKTKLAYHTLSNLSKKVSMKSDDKVDELILEEDENCDEIVLNEELYAWESCTIKPQPKDDLTDDELLNLAILENTEQRINIYLTCILIGGNVASSAKNIYDVKNYMSRTINDNCNDKKLVLRLRVSLKIISECYSLGDWILKFISISCLTPAEFIIFAKIFDEEIYHGIQANKLKQIERCIISDLNSIIRSHLSDRYYKEELRLLQDKRGFTDDLSFKNSVLSMDDILTSGLHLNIKSTFESLKTYFSKGVNNELITWPGEFSESMNLAEKLFPKIKNNYLGFGKATIDFIEFYLQFKKDNFDYINRLE